jgi:type III pantothenate kinase
MLLAVDIGNTATKFGVFDGDTAVENIVIATRRNASADDLARMVADRISGVTGSIVSSVVPEINDAMRVFLAEATGSEPRFVAKTDDLGLTFNFSIETTGTDRLVNSFAAAELHGTPCIAISFGTATTIDVVSKDRRYLGGLIAPGPKTSAKALELVTSKLPNVDIVDTANVISATTEGAIQAGILYAQVGLIETVIPQMKLQIGKDAKTIATGGFAPLFAAKCGSIDVVEPDLTLLGLKMLYSRA